MKPCAILSLLVLALSGAACHHTDTGRSGGSRSAATGAPDSRPYNLQKAEFEDPTPPKHRTSPGDAAR